MNAILDGDAESLLNDVKQVCKISDRQLKILSQKSRSSNYGGATPKGYYDVTLQVLVPLVDFDGEGLNGKQMNSGPHKPAPGEVLNIYLINKVGNYNDFTDTTSITVKYNINNSSISWFSLENYPQLAY